MVTGLQTVERVLFFASSTSSIKIYIFILSHLPSFAF